MVLFIKSVTCQINPGRHKQPGWVNTLNAAQEFTITLDCVFVPCYKSVRPYPALKGLFNTFQILLWHQGYFLTKHITDSSTVLSWMVVSCKKKQTILHEHSACFNTIFLSTFVVDCILFYAFPSLHLSQVVKVLLPYFLN